MKRIKRILKDNSGSSKILGSFIALSLLIASFICFESPHLYIAGLGVRDAVQNAVTTACTENYDRLYNGVREGYSGGYKLVGNSWSEDIDTGDIYSKLDTTLGTRAEGGKHIKYAGNNVAYSISDLSVKITNTSFAPGNPESTNKFTGVAYVTLHVPFGFGWGNLPPMEIHMKVVSGYTAKF